MTLVKQADPDVVIVEPTAATQKHNLAEEQARLLVGVFGRLTSVVFDVDAITDLMNKEDQPAALKELLAHTLVCSLVHIKHHSLATQRMAVGSSQHNVIFKRYWELASTNIKLSKLNELLQSNRDSPALMEPLLRVLMDVQADESESYGDVLNLLKVGMAKYDTESNAMLLKTMSRSLRRI